MTTTAIPIVWWRTILPSNSLAALNGLARDAAEREVLGPDVQFNLIPIDECNQHVVPAKIIPRHPPPRLEGIDRPGRGAVEPVPPRARPSPANSAPPAFPW